jgi:hypothetical protein
LDDFGLIAPDLDDGWRGRDAASAGARQVPRVTATLILMARVRERARAGSRLVVAAGRSQRIRRCASGRRLHATPGPDLGLSAPRHGEQADRLRAEHVRSTVKVHIRNIMKKLHATNRTQVVYLTNSLFETGGPFRRGD